MGGAAQYSAAHGSWDPWALNHLLRFGVCLVVLLFCAITDIRSWWRYAYVIYGVILCLLVAVHLVGYAGMGALRWVDLGFVKLQPSELMKLGIVLALARYFHETRLDNSGQLTFLVVPIGLIAVPTLLVFDQPDLGTAANLGLVGAVVLFLAGVRLWKFGAVLVAAAAAIPIVWGQLREYQQRRILTFLDPESDPLGAGYHILQSKIALGSGGMEGKGFLQGSQSHLNFLPEQHTDFVFTVLAEEFGLWGGLLLLGVYSLLIVNCLVIAVRSQNHFGRLLASGLSVVLFLYVFINVAMVTALVPVVGVPLPLVSYGGSAMLTVMMSVGLICSVYVHRNVSHIGP